MGIKSKPPVTIELSHPGTEVQSNDGLPAFSRYVDINGLERGKKCLTRLFLATPTDEDIADTLKLRKLSPEIEVVGASMKKIRATITLFTHCRASGLSEEFSTDLIRLVINYLQGKNLGASSVGKCVIAIKELVVSLAAQMPIPSALTAIDKDFWLNFLTDMEDGQSKSAKSTFNFARAPFVNYEPTSQNGWLMNIPFREARRKKPASEHTSESAEVNDYSDVVMYQLLALFIYEFDRRIGYLKHYENIGEKDMPTDWLYPGRKAVIGKNSVRDTAELVRQWLQEEGDGYGILVDHHLMHYKAGLIRRNEYGSLAGGIARILANFSQKRESPLVSRFRSEMELRYGYTTKGRVSFFNFYLKKNSAAETNSVINQIGWCLANLVMMQTGVNKEVVLTIPSKSEDGRSILNRGDTIFVKKDGTETEVHLFGTKARTGNDTAMKTIPIIISKTSPLYEMLVQYEKYVKVGDGPFF